MEHGLQVCEGDVIGVGGVCATKEGHLQMSSEICFVCWLSMRCLVGFDECILLGGIIK